jgi:hypothetical protein
MAGFLHFMRCVGRAVVRNGGRALASLVPLGEGIFEIARDAHEDYRRDRSEDELRADLESLARATPAEVRRTAEQAAAQVAEAQTPEIRLALVSYLDQMPEALTERVQELSAHDAVPVVVNGPTRAYTLDRRLAVGDVADLHLAGDGSDPSFILKVSRIPEGHTFLDNERGVLSDLASAAGDTTYRRYLPALVESFAAKDGFRKRVNVFAFEPGFFTLEQVHKQHPALDARHLAWIFKRLLEVLGFAHGQRTLHGAVVPCHVMVHAANHGLRLVGWGQSVETGGRVDSVPTRYRDWYPPEVLKKRPALPATDLFLAARCMIYLAGGDPESDRMPDAVPESVRRFVQCCLLPGVTMRPGDAWALLDELDGLLLRLYGPPKFHELTMTSGE